MYYFQYKKKMEVLIKKMELYVKTVTTLIEKNTIIPRSLEMTTKKIKVVNSVNNTNNNKKKTKIVDSVKNII